MAVIDYRRCSKDRARNVTAGPAVSAEAGARRRYQCRTGCGLRFKTTLDTKACPRCKRRLSFLGYAEA